MVHILSLRGFFFYNIYDFKIKNIWEKSYVLRFDVQNKFVFNI